MSEPGATLHQRAVEYLRSQIHNPAYVAEGRLPTVKQLSLMSRFSLHTILSAVEQLRREGLLVPVRGKGLLIAARLGADSDTHVPGARSGVSRVGSPQRWRETAERVFDDIAAGVFRPGTMLPSLKEMQQRYGVCFATMKKALTALERTVGLVRHRKRFMIPLHRPTRGGKILVHRPPTSSSPRQEQFMRSLEQESRRRMLSYEAIVYPEKETETGRGLARVDAGGGADIILGHVVWAFGLAGFPRIIAKLGRLDTPVAVVDEYGDVAPETIHAAGGKTRTYRIGSSQSAPRRVARLLLQNGHRHVAYISPIHTYPWTRMRFRVLNDTFTAAHRRNTVSLFTSDSSRQTELLYSQFHVLHRAPELIAFLNRFSSSYLALSDAEAFRRLEHEITAILNRIERLPHVNDFFDGILRDERITAWIASNDLDALLALNYLRAKRVDIPKELSLVSFDDASEAYSYNFSSYNFNVPAVVQGILDYFLAPAATSGRERVIEAPGMVVERGTTGPAPMRR